MKNENEFMGTSKGISTSKKASEPLVVTGLSIPESYSSGRFIGKASAYLNSLLINFALGTSSLRNEAFEQLKRSTVFIKFSKLARINQIKSTFTIAAKSERGDVPGWVLVVLMTTGLVTGIWTVAQPRLSSILKNSLDNMNGIR
jgi:hypothetical protein